MKTPFMVDNCAVREYTSSGQSVGRCWFYVKNGTCPRHGDVTAVQSRYVLTGELTDEPDLPTKTS